MISKSCQTFILSINFIKSSINPQGWPLAAQAMHQRRPSTRWHVYWPFSQASTYFSTEEAIVFLSYKSSYSGTHYCMQLAHLSEQKHRDGRSTESASTDKTTCCGPDCIFNFVQCTFSKKVPLCSLSKIHMFFLGFCNFSCTPLFWFFILWKMKRVNITFNLLIET